MLDAKHSELREQTNRIGIDFLFAELEMALTFLQVGESSDSQESRHRNFEKALEGYRTVLHFLPRVVPSTDQQAQLQLQMEKVKHRLEEGGYSCGT